MKDETIAVSKKKRRKAFDNAGHKLARAHQNSRNDPQSQVKHAAFAEAAQQLLQAARNLPDKGPTQKEWNGEPSLAAKLFGAAYGHQRDPENPAIQSQLLTFAVVFYGQRQDPGKENPKPSSQKKPRQRAERDRFKETTPGERRTGGMRPLPSQRDSAKKKTETVHRRRTRVDLSRNKRK